MITNVRFRLQPRPIGLLLIAWLISACAHLQPLPKAEQNVRHGRFVVRYQDQAGKNQGLQGRFQWIEQNDQLIINLLNPLGQSVARLWAGPNGAKIERPQQRPIVACQLESLMEKTLGFSLPVTELRAGLQLPLRPERLSSLRQSLKAQGWTLTTSTTNLNRLWLERQRPFTRVGLLFEPRL